MARDEARRAGDSRRHEELQALLCCRSDVYVPGKSTLFADRSIMISGLHDEEWPALQARSQAVGVLLG